MFHWVFFIILIFSLPLNAGYKWHWRSPDRDREEHKPTSETISYGGLSFECDSGCGQYPEDPDLEKIDKIFSKTLRQIFKEDCPVDIHEGHCNWLELWEGEECSYGSFSANSIHANYFDLCNYLDFQAAAAWLIEDIQFQHYQTLQYHQQRLSIWRENLHFLQTHDPEDLLYVKFRDIKITEIGYRKFYDAYPRERAIENVLEEILGTQLTIDEENSRHQKNLTIYDQAYRKIDALYEHIFLWCLENHQPEGISFQAGLEAFRNGDFEEALRQIKKLIALAEKSKFEPDILAKIHLLKGQVESEMNLYVEAIESLSNSIQKMPNLKEAYFERASAYFELGQFDQAIEDYLKQRDPSLFEALTLLDSIEFSLGFTTGAGKGMVHSATEFIPSTLSTFYGLGSAAWATITHPIETPKRYIEASLKLCEQLRNCSPLELAEIAVPELASLIKNWESLTSRDRGNDLGYLIGKYGTDILGPTALVKGSRYFASFQDLKNANKLAALESLAGEASSSSTVKTAQEWAQHRNDNIGKIKIEIDKQNKHIPGMHNYEKGKSILNKDINPQELLDNFSGKGRKLVKFDGGPGIAGYKEKVNFGKIIGSHVHETTGVATPTTWGMIIYSNEGAHIVPMLPDVY